jgi:hypothetical protein
MKSGKVRSAGLTGDEKKPAAPVKHTFLHAGVDTTPFNPLDTKNLGIAVVKALLEKKAHSLSSLPAFRGAGIYAIYYHGSFKPYAPIAEANSVANDPRWPIYVGKAIPEGGRKGAFSTSVTDTPALNKRLKDHRKSIEHATNLDISHFSCRFLVVQDLWIPLGEQLLIAHFAPIWNRVLDGFGNHNTGSGRHEGLRPRWDVLHPGRTWADKLKNRVETAEEIAREVAQHLKVAAVPSLSLIAGDLSGK